MLSYYVQHERHLTIAVFLALSDCPNCF